MSKLHNAMGITATIFAEDGATWGDIEVPTFGYMVSVKGYEYVTDVYTFGPDTVEAYEAATPLREGMYYGAWIDGTDVYLDASLWVPTEAEALMIADLEDQKAIYSLYDHEVIDLR